MHTNKLELLEGIARRRSTYPRSFGPGEVTDEQLETMLQAAHWAPTHKMTHPWRFKVVRGSGITRLGHWLAERYRQHPKGGVFLQKKYDSILRKAQASSAIILLCMQRDPASRVPEWEEIAAVSMAVQNLWLAATAVGVGGYWSSPPHIDHVGEFTSLQAGERCLGFFYAGCQSDEPVDIPDRIDWRTCVSWIDH